MAGRVGYGRVHQHTVKLRSTITSKALVSNSFLLLLVRQLLLEAMHLLLVASFYCFCYVLLFPQSFNMRRAGPTLLLRRGVGWDSYCREDGKTKIVRPSFPPHDMSIDCLHMESEEECAS